MRQIGGLTQVGYYNWAGYADDASTGNSYTMVSGAWTQPAITCPTDEDRMAVWWVGLDGFTNGTVEQDGTLGFCTGGVASYYTWWEMVPTNAVQVVGDTVVPGDKIAASVNFTGGHFVLKVTDSTTTANSFSVNESCAEGVTCARSSAEWIAETPLRTRGLSPWPNFGTWLLTGAKVKSGTTTGTISSFPDNEITIVGNDERHLADTGSLRNSGKAFNVKWAYAYS